MLCFYVEVSGKFKSSILEVSRGVKICILRTRFKNDGSKLKICKAQYVFMPEVFVFVYLFTHFLVSQG